MSIVNILIWALIIFVLIGILVTVLGYAFSGFACLVMGFMGLINLFKEGFILIYDKIRGMTKPKKK